MIEDSTPKYLILKAQLKKLAENKGPGYKIPSISALMKQHNLSITTVSRAIRELVVEGYLTALQGSGTFVNELPNTHVNKNNRNIGLVVDQSVFQHPFISHITHSCTRAAREQRYNIVNVLQKKEKLFTSGNEEFLANLERGYFGGLLLASPVCAEDFARLFDFGTKFVVISDEYTDNRIYSVSVQHYYSNYKLVDYCVQKGKKNILYIGGPSDTYRYYVALDAYKTCFKEHGLEYKEENFRSTNWTDTEASKIVCTRFAHDENRPDAIVARDGVIAHGAYCALRSLHIDVPEEVLLVQGNEIIANPMLSRVIPCMVVGVYKMGTVATEMLIKLIEGQEVTERKIYMESTIRELSPAQVVSDMAAHRNLR